MAEAVLVCGIAVWVRVEGSVSQLTLSLSGQGLGATLVTLKEDLGREVKFP